MTRLILFLSLAVFTAVLLLSASQALAQSRIAAAPQRAGHGLIQNDYDRYAQLFQNNRDPNFVTSDTWRRIYSRNQWRIFAAGSETRDPMHPAQTLTAIYLVSHLDNQLAGQISDIILSKAALGAELSENISLRLIGSYFDRSTDPELVERRDNSSDANDWFSPIEQDRMEFLNLNIDQRVRQRIVSGQGISSARLNEARGLQNRFIERDTDWVSKYYFMRERLNLLDELAKHFPFNWTPEERAANQERERQAVLADASLRRQIENEVRTAQTRGGRDDGSSDGGGSSQFDGGGSEFGGGDFSDEGFLMPTPGVDPAEAAARREEQIQAEVERRLAVRADENVRDNENRYRAFRYIVGSYQGSDYHLELLYTIYQYLLKAAESGDPIAQYHLALFLINLGDIVDPHTGIQSHRSEAERWLNRAAQSDIARDRVNEVRTLIAAGASRQQRRSQNYAVRLGTLTQVEEDKIDMYVDVLIGVRDSIQSSGSGSARGRSGGQGSGGQSGRQGTGGNRNQGRNSGNN